MQDNKWSDILTSCKKAEMYEENLKSCTDEEEFTMLLFNYILNELDIKYQFLNFTEELINTNDKLLDSLLKKLEIYQKQISKLNIVKNILAIVLFTLLVLDVFKII